MTASQISSHPKHRRSQPLPTLVGADAPSSDAGTVVASQTASWDELVRMRAYALYERRGCEPGHEMEDWLRAESELGQSGSTATAS